MIRSMSFVPSPPLLRPELAGAAANELDDLRAACVTSINESTRNVDTVVLVGSGAALALGEWILDLAGWAGTRKTAAVPSALSMPDCRALGQRLAAEQTSAALLVVGDGSARRSLNAPGYYDPRAQEFDASTAAALRCGDTDALLRLDPELASELLAAGRAAWQVAAGAAGGAARHGPGLLR